MIRPEIMGVGTMSAKFLRRLVLIILILGGAIFAIFKLVAPATIDVVKPHRGPAVQAIYATGTVQPSVEVRIAPRMPGRLIALKADEGQRVRQGQVLAQLDAGDMKLAIDEQAARARNAEQSFGRVQKLFQQGWSTRAALDQARAERDAAKASLNRLHEQMSYMSLTAPAAGLVIRRDGEVGDYIPINQPVFFLACCAPLRIEADVDEEDIPLTRLGQKVLIRADAFPDQMFTGRVSEITPKGDSVSRSYRVRILFSEDAPLKIGMTADTNIIVAERQNALLIPLSALTGNFAWLVEGGRLVKRIVTVGARGDVNAEIRSGLKEGEVVVVSPTDALKEGQKVQTRLVTSSTKAATKEGRSKRA